MEAKGEERPVRPRPKIKLPLNPPMARPQATNIPNNKVGGGAGAEAGGRPCPEHSFLTDVADVVQMEQGLLQLLDDFHSGKLQAFGQDCTFEKMDQVRERQEHLARLHFDLDNLQEEQSDDTSSENREVANKNMEKLMDNLQDLCVSIQNLQKDHSAPHS